MTGQALGTEQSGEASGRFASRAAEVTYTDLSPAVVTAAKRGLLDTLGVALAAAGTQSAYLAPVRVVLAQSAAPGTVPAAALTERVSLFDSILWFGALTHTLDFDDVAGYCHPSAPAVSAALPLAHARAPVDGHRLIEAVAVGQDLVIKLTQSLPRPTSDYGWLPSIPGTFGAALTSAKLLGLDAGETRNSLGLALHQTSGTMQSLARPGSGFRAVREGFSARAGVLAALLAQAGMPGDDESIEGQFGYFGQFFNREYDAGFLHGSEFLGPLIAFKPWPCAGHPSLFLTALARLLEEGEVEADSVRAIRVVGFDATLLEHQCAPVSERAAPAHSIDAKVSIPFLIGKMIRRGTLTIDSFATDGLADPEAVELGKRVSWRADPGLQRGANGFGAGIVEVEHEDGRTARADTEYPLGHPGNPLSWDQMVQKFRACVDASPLDSARVSNRIVTIVENLETIDDVGVILDAVLDDRQGDDA